MADNNTTRQSPLVRRVLRRFLFLALIWLVLCGSEQASWILGLPAVLIAVLISLMLAPYSEFSFSFSGLCSFIPFFLRQSSLSGFDVMRRALAVQPDINPGLVPYTTFLPQGAPRIFFVNTISLLPGTLSAELHGNEVTVHTIDKDLAIWATIQNLELRIAYLFRIGPPVEVKK
ncbi:MAG: Na+/H+ antiporter subunit E [Desulfobulbaceae bacterium]|nr:Na+/H+ antiporter subunit E [Desulfobulbaceae bacterium]